MKPTIQRPDNPATDKQVRFILDLLKSTDGVARHEECGASLARRYSLPRADTIEEAVKSLTVQGASKLIEALKG